MRPYLTIEIGFTQVEKKILSLSGINIEESYR